MGSRKAIRSITVETAELATQRRGVLADRCGNLILFSAIAVHGFDGAALLTGQAAVVWHFGSAWSLNQKPPTAPGLLPTLPRALAA